MANCFICNYQQATIKEDRRTEMSLVDCAKCGSYIISMKAAIMIPSTVNDIHLLSGYLRERSYRKYPLIEITTENLSQLVTSLIAPLNINEKLNRLILYLAIKSSHYGERLQITPQLDYPVTYSKEGDDFRGLLEFLAASGKIAVIEDFTAAIYLTLTLDGWNKYEELQLNPATINQAFVAMWFGQPDHVEKMNNIFTNGIKKAVDDAETSPKYKPVKIDLVEHNDPIDQKILVEIRRSRFVIADLTGNRGGVYFEAGYALSLGMPVIWMCEKGTKVHFDVGQFSRIEWESENDLYEKLKRRIEGSIF